MAETEGLDGELQVVVFTVGGEEYGLGIEKVQEIIRPLPITRVPRAPERIEGVVNQRGNVIPVVNLHRRLAIGQRTISDQNRIIIIRRPDITVGIIVDSVKEVLNLSTDRIESPTLAEMSDVAHLSGIGKISGRIILLLDLDNLLGVG